MTLKELEKKIEEIEKRVSELESHTLYRWMPPTTTTSTGAVNDKDISF